MATESVDDELRQILDKHAEYYIRETMKFFQNEGVSPALSKDNLGDLEALTALQTLIAHHTKEAVDGNTSDGYHTFNELYDFRKLFNALLFNEWAWHEAQYGGTFKPVKSKRHSDGELCFGGGWFIVVAQLPVGQISNHYELKDWDLFQIPEVDKAPEWDGHTPQDVLKRLAELAAPQQSASPDGERKDDSGNN